MVEMYGLAQMGQAPLLHPMNRCNPNPRPAPSTIERTVRTNNWGLLSLTYWSLARQKGFAEPIRRRMALTGKGFHHEGRHRIERQSRESGQCRRT